MTRRRGSAPAAAAAVLGLLLLAPAMASMGWEMNSDCE